MRTAILALVIGMLLIRWLPALPPITWLWGLGLGGLVLLPLRLYPLGCLLLLKDQLGDLSGMKAVVVGRSNIVGKPMANLLLQQNCSVTVLHSRSRNLEEECRQADILVLAIGRPKMIGADCVKPGAVVIDVGINRIERDGKIRLVGDVQYESAASVAGALLITGRGD